MNNASLSFESLNLSSTVSLKVQEVLQHLQAKQTRQSKQVTKQRKWQICVLASMVVFIGCVSVYDVYWSFRTADIMVETEQNPIGTFLINADGGDISLFMTCKMVGTMIVLLSIPALYCYKRNWGMIIGSAVATFQALLMVYLNFGHLLGNGI